MAGRYHLISALGNGGMGTVWLAEDDILSRRVAVKEVSPPAEMTEREREMLRERTLREARTAARLSHPNVVTIYDVVEDDGRPWIVMELIPSRSLRDLVEADGPLTAQQAAGVGLQILAALRAAHALGIMHRDVKPGNVLVDAGGRAVLADFGIARTQDSPALTTSGVLVGSPSYIAPERARGEPGGPESDLWSLGATLYALVEGRPAYDRAGALATLMAVVNEDPDPPSRAGALWPVIRGLLDHVPSRRPGPDEAERMLREIADTAGGSQTVPFPVVPPPAAGGGTVPGTGPHGAAWKAPSTLARSGRGTLSRRPKLTPARMSRRPALCLRNPLRTPCRTSLSPMPSRMNLILTRSPISPIPTPCRTSLILMPSLKNPTPRPLPEEPDPRALPEEPGSFAEPEADPPPREPEPALLAEGPDAAAGAAVATSQGQAPQPEPGRAPEPSATAPGLIPGLARLVPSLGGDPQNTHLAAPEAAHLGGGHGCGGHRGGGRSDQHDREQSPHGPGRAESGPRYGPSHVLAFGLAHTEREVQRPDERTAVLARGDTDLDINIGIRVRIGIGPARPGRHPGRLPQVREFDRLLDRRA